MIAADLPLLVIAALFAATAFRGFHLGLAAFPAAFIVGAFNGRDAETVIGFFPADFFILIVGVTSLFAIAQSNGTMDWVFSRSLKLLGGRVAFIPWLVFALTGLLTGVGTLPTAAIAIMAPMSIGFAIRYGISPFLMSLVTVLGMISGMFSPIAVFGLTAVNLYEEAAVETTASLPLILMFASLATGLAMCTAFVATNKIVGSRRVAAGVPASASLREGAPGDPHSGTSQVATDAIDKPNSGSADEASRTASGGERDLTAPIALTVAALGALILCAVAFDLNVGFVGLTLTLVLQLLFRIEPNDVINRVPWAVVMLIGGTLTFIGLMQDMGSFERLSDLLTADGSPMLSLLFVCYLAAVTSFFAASISVFATAVPLLPSLIEAGVPPVGALLALAMSSILVDINPLGPTGGYLLAATPTDRRGRLFRQLLIYGMSSVVVIPPITVLAFGWI